MYKIGSKWVREEKGATAIEFAMLCMPYLLLVLGIIEMALMFTAESLLEGATTKAARQIRTGAMQTSGSADLEGDFRNAVCSYATVLIKCEDIVIESQTMESFTDFSNLQPEFDEDGNLVPQGFSIGGSSDRVMVRTAYSYTAITPIVGPLLFGSDSTRLFISTMVLQAEPYDFSAEVAANGG